MLKTKDKTHTMKRILLSIILAFAIIPAFVLPVSAQWSLVGSAGISSSVANFTAMAVDNNNTPYIAYSDNGQSNKLTVQKYNGTNWVTVGGAGISSGSAEHISIAIDGSNNIYVGFRDGGQSGKVTVMKYDGSSWSALGGAGLSDGGAYYVAVGINASGTVYVAYQDQTAGSKGSVKRFNGSSWVYVGSKGFTSGQTDYLDMCIDGGGSLYIAYRDNNIGWKPRVMKYNGSSWSTLGSAGFSAGGISEIAIAVDGNNKPYVIYKDWSQSNKATVQAYSGSSWALVGSAGFSSNGIGSPDIAVDGNNTPYVVYRDDGNNQKATVMSFNGSTWAAVTSAGFSANTVDYSSIAIDPGNNTIYVGFKDNAVSQKATVMKHAGAPPLVNTWTGNNSTSWNTAGNWSVNAVPTVSDNVKIPSGRSRYPDISSGTASCKSIAIASGASVTVDGGTLRIAGGIDNSGVLDAEDGRIELVGSSAQTIPVGAFKNNTVRYFELDNSSGASLSDTLKITDAYYPTSGKMVTNGKLVLKSNATRTARIAEGSGSGNYIDGNVTVERYIPGRRAFRFLSHPFGNAISLDQLTDDIDITGPGGATNGFTPVQVNAASAFWFDQFSADNSTYGTNPGWKEFTSAYGLYWDPYEMARILIRGEKGQGLTGNTYTARAVTLDMSGSLNQGDKLVGLAKGSNSNFVICGNPYASPVEMSQLVRTNIASAFVVWNPYQGQRGGYTSRYFSWGYVLPAYAGFVTAIYSGSVGYINFLESHKSGSTPAGLLKPTAPDFKVELAIEDTATFWDMLAIDFDSTGMAVQDTFDMIKLNNPDVDFYTLSDDNQPLSIDMRPYEDNKTIKLGFMPYMEQRFVLKVPSMVVPAGVKLYLYDKFLNKTEELTEGYEYWFDATADSNSYGHDRFSINMVGTPADVSVLNHRTNATMQLIPNPAQASVKVSFEKVEGTDAMMKLMDITGKLLYTTRVAQGQGSVTIPLVDLPNGIYIVELNAQNTRIVEKLVKQ
jgi:hypothetical protein